MLFLKARLFASSRKLIPVAERSEKLQMSIRSAFQKKNKTGEREEPWEMACSDKKGDEEKP